MNELSGRLGRARFLRLGWFKVPAAPAASSPFSLGSLAQVTINGTNVSGYIHTAELKRTTEVADTPGLLSTFTTKKALNNTAELSIEGFSDPTFKTTLNSIDRSVVSWSYSPAGTATGTTTHSGKAKINLHNEQSNVKDATTLKADLSVIGEITYSTN